jgi:hypothetical protein
MLLGGCERMSRRPYDSYLPLHGKLHVCTHAEKQQGAINILIQQPSPLNNYTPTVLTIICGGLVRKKTLVAHVCNDERVRA